MPQLPTFAEALAELKGSKQPHVLLGNGFSRACRDDIFAYGALFDRANFDSLSVHARDAFERLETTDFEVAIRSLRQAAALIELYENANRGLYEQLRSDANGLREVLVSAIASSHPERPSDIAPGAYAACKRFLSNFHRIFTVNYDLLLYWALMQSEIEPHVQCDDGFRSPEHEADYVTWEPENTYKQNVYYLHGALHIFDSGLEIQKYTWTKTGIRLIEQVRSALQANRYPLFVAEGESDRKLERVRHSDYLAKAHRGMLPSSGAMFTYGHSFAENDAHILRLIAKSKVDRLIVAIYGDPESPANQEIISRAEGLRTERSTQKPLAVSFYDAASAHVWG